ncbi:MAG: hypothetical protein KAS32_23465 [Candidatus Peribacteraceae bacterium]|nr:hypothetical protein [Candidatus Peribacteraceae bacterium]
MATVTTRTKLSTRILQDLGEPVIKVNVDTVHVESAIDDAVEYFHQYHRDGTHRTFAAIKLTADHITNSEVALPDTVSDVIEVIGLGMNTKGFATNEWQLKASIMDISSTAGFIALGDYVMMRAMFDNTSYILNTTPFYVFRKYLQTVEFTEGLDDYAVDDYLVFECYQNVDMTAEPKLYGEPWIREYATAIVKKVWGGILSKYSNITMAGGIQLDGSSIKQEAIGEMTRLEDKLKAEMQAPPMFFVG